MRTALALTVLVLFAGCASLTGGPGPDDPTGSTPTVTDSPPSTPERTGHGTPTATPTPTPTATPTPTPAQPANPWRAETVTVALVSHGHERIDYAATLRSAVAYWNDNMAFANYSVNLRYVEASTSADVVVEIRDSVGTCGYEESTRFVGCAPLYTTGDRAERPTPVLIEAGYDRRSTRSIMIHELGHVLGVRHGDPPSAYMEASGAVLRVERPDADERAYPWRTDDFDVYVAAENLPADERAGAREQVGHVVDYYNRIADEDPDVPANVTLRRVSDRSDADVVVRFPGSLPCGSGDGSCGVPYGRDSDGDLAVEYYRNLTVSVSGVDTDAVGWHTGYWFGRSLGLSGSELPAPFRDAAPVTRRSRWWEQDP